MADIGEDLGRPALHQRDRGVAQGAGAVGDVVDQDAAAAVDVADHVHHLGHAGLLAPLVDDGEVGIQALRHRAGADHAADIGRDDDQVLAGEAAADVLHEHRRGHQIVQRDVEEALDLAGMQVEGQHPVGAGAGDQVGDQLGRDRRARAGLAVLPGIAVIGHHRGDPAGRAAAQRVDGDQHLHQVVIRREAGRLDHEDILAADVLQDLDEDLHVGEAPHRGLGQRDLQIGSDRLAERAIAVAGDDFHLGRLGGLGRWPGPDAAAYIPRAPGCKRTKRNPDPELSHHHQHAAAEQRHDDEQEQGDQMRHGVSPSAGSPRSAGRNPAPGAASSRR